jgi:hypothetical protein
MLYLRDLLPVFLFSPLFISRPASSRRLCSRLVREFSRKSRAKHVGVIYDVHIYIYNIYSSKDPSSFFTVILRKPSWRMILRVLCVATNSLALIDCIRCTVAPPNAISNTALPVYSPFYPPPWMNIPWPRMVLIK